ncbi:MAG: hypothetical protein Q6352_013205 [Candidatus Freyrarchaeum guaymaensis]|nr:hypothetical protein [Candidatus Sigynarchaeota archaeon]
MAIRNLYVFKSSGLLLFHKDYQSVSADSDLVAGFFSAIQSFAENLLQEKETELHSMNLGKYTFIFQSDDDLEITVVIVVDDVKKDQANAKRIMDALLKIFREKKLVVKNFDGNLEEFEDVSQKLDEMVKPESLDKRAVQALWE